MRTVRRLYFYVVTFIGLEMVIWGAISLAQTLLEAPPGGAADLLSSGLALVLVGVPVFLLHGAVVQRDAGRDPEERANRLRAIFFYTVRLTTQVPVLTSAIYILERLVLALLGLPASGSYLGINQSLVVDLTTLAGNGLAWYAALRLLRREESAAAPEGSPLEEVGRLYRYLWMTLTLAIATWGTGTLVLYLIDSVGLFARQSQDLVEGLACTLVAAPLWAQAWTGIVRGLARPVERKSTLRLVVLYGLALGPAAAVVLLGVEIVYGLLNMVLGQNQTLAGYILTYSNSLASLLPLGVLWAFFRRALAQAWADEGDELRRAMLLRLYRTGLAALGNAVTFFGAWQLLTFLVDLSAGGTVFNGGLREQLSTSLAALGVGLWTWLPPWLALQAEAAQADEPGDHACRSIQRRVMLYLVIFLSIVGVMVNAGMLLYRLFNAALGNSVPNLGLDSAHSLANLALFGVWLVYHQAALRADGRRAQAALARRQAAYPVLLFSGGDAEFQSELQSALQSAAPGLVLTVYAGAEGSPLPAVDQFKAAVLPAELDLFGKDALGTWLAGFTGVRLVAPLPAPGRVWLGLPPRSRRELGRETAMALRQLAEGEPLRATPPNNPWVIAGYVFGGLFALELAFVVLAIVESFLQSSRF